MHLRSVKEVTGYHLQATDGAIGHVDDFVADDAGWIVRYMVVDTRNWLPGRRVLVPPVWIDRFDWHSRSAFVDLDRDQVKGSPEFDANEPINREYEAKFYDYYGRPRYWVD